MTFFGVFVTALMAFSTTNANAEAVPSMDSQSALSQPGEGIVIERKSDLSAYKSRPYYEKLVYVQNQLNYRSDFKGYAVFAPQNNLVTYRDVFFEFEKETYLRSGGKYQILLAAKKSGKKSDSLGRRYYLLGSMTNMKDGLVFVAEDSVESAQRRSRYFCFFMGMRGNGYRGHEESPIPVGWEDSLKTKVGELTTLKGIRTLNIRWLPGATDNSDYISGVPDPLTNKILVMSDESLLARYNFINSVACRVP